MENIEFRAVPDEIQPRWDTAMDFLRTKSQEERLQLLDQASREYAESYRRLRHQWLKEKTIDVPTFDASCEREFGRVFEKHLS